MNKECKELLKEMMVEKIDKDMCDSGGAYGYQYEKNQKGFITDDEYPIDFYESDNEIELDGTVELYPFLSKHLDRDSQCNVVEKELYNYLNDNDIDYKSIFEIKDALEQLRINPHNYTDVFTDDEYYDDDLELDCISDIINTYNYNSILSQIIQYITFEFEGVDYILLQIHNGCDIRSGYTNPHIFEINDIDYFMMYMNSVQVYCGCDNIDYTFDNYELFDDYGDLVENNVYDKVYIDNDVLRCKKCGEIVKQYICDF